MRRRLPVDPERGWKLEREGAPQVLGGTDGAEPTAGVILDQSGNLYGTTFFGGIPGYCPGKSSFLEGCGVVFQLTPNADGSWKEHVLHAFTGGEDGAWPYFAGVIFDQSGNLYGTTPYGGDLSLADDGGWGVVFRLSPNVDGSWKENVLHNFLDTTGALPSAGLVFGPSGNLFGTTDGDQYTTFGTVFELSP